jgi:hypothetical protein
MRGLEAACAAIVIAYLVMRLARADRPWRVAARLGLLGVAGFVGEDTVIRAYRFYAYSAKWSVFVDQVPLLIAVIWPTVIDSAAELAARLTDRRGAPLLAALVVLADASLIEPIAVHAGLWTWREGGLFAVPLIGITGWSFFAWASAAWQSRWRGAREVLVIAVAPFVTHALIVASWWAVFRWVRGPVAIAPALGVVWMVLAGVAVAARGARVAWPVVLARAPGAAFFFALLALSGAPAALVAYALAFVPPYLAVMRWRQGGARAPDALSRWRG